ncbi:MAG: hypothetical protein A2V64_06830 [Bacteroidetes bacterium RBG_13_43_22]|nr:MAG: hypothetical protein A2V64_06830 [Bacteroidetes bacterium RBG_13_43_22]
MGKRIIFFILLIVPVMALKAQTGGDNIYEFLNLTHSGLVSSVGGSNVSLNSDNLNLAYHNPALLNSNMNKNAALNYVNYFAGVNYGLAMYSQSFEEIGSFAAGITYLNYGSFSEADASGVITGSFTASEYAFSMIYSREIDTLFSVGINFKPVLSHLERYTSFGFAFDFGAGYRNRSGLFSAGLVIRNVGLQVTKYAGEERQKLPFEIQAGFSQKLAHAPFRFSLTLKHLEKYDLTYQYNDNDTSSVKKNFLQSSEFLENMMRHVVVGVELIPHKNFYFSTGFNYQRRRELQVESKISTAGFSWGFGITTSYLNIEFGRATYHLAGSSSHISLILKTDRIYNRFRE